MIEIHKKKNKSVLKWPFSATIKSLKSVCVGGGGTEAL